MARTRGSRNLQYDVRRLELLFEVRARLAEPGSSGTSLRELALACGVSVATLRHYFPRREDLILAVMSENLADARPHLAHAAEPHGPFAASIRELLGYIAFGFTQGVGDIYTVGLTEGLREPTVGPGFVNLVLEPSIDAVRRRLDAHVAMKHMREVDTRHAALSLLSPVVLLMLHQRELGGSVDHPVDVDRFLDDHAGGFVRAYGRTVAAPTRQRSAPA